MTRRTRVSRSDATESLVFAALDREKGNADPGAGQVRGPDSGRLTDVLRCVHMARIGVRELRQNASEWIRRANAGERVEVTRRGEVVAILGRPLPDGRLAALRQARRLKPASVGAPLPSAVSTRRPASQALAELRADER